MDTHTDGEREKLILNRYLLFSNNVVLHVVFGKHEEFCVDVVLIKN